MSTFGGVVERFWLRSYPAAVPPEIDYFQYRSLVQLLEEAFRKYSAQVAFSCMGADMTYRELDQRSAAESGPLGRRQGHRHGEGLGVEDPLPERIVELAPVNEAAIHQRRVSRGEVKRGNGDAMAV